MSKYKMSNEEKIAYLQNQYNYNHATAVVYIQSKGICTYCGENLLEFRQGYSSGVVDHLLPSVKYPELSDDINNTVYCCSSCNQMKGKYNALENGEDPCIMLTKRREVLIDRIREHLRERISKRTYEYEDIKELLQGP